MQTAFVTALLSLLGALVGSYIGFILSKRKSRGDELAKMRLDAYGDFIKNAMRVATARRLGVVREELPELVSLNDAKARICVCGDASVVAALEEFWLNGGTLELEQEIIAFSSLCRRMRESLGQERLPLDVKLSDVLFRLKPSSYAFKVSEK
jgi:hypothetical protein